MVRWAFDILGIEATKDVQEIKGAYAALVRKCHPEDHPAEWARIHEAYQAAMEYAKTTSPSAGGSMDESQDENCGWEDGNWQEEFEPLESGFNNYGREAENGEETYKNETFQDTEVIENEEYNTMFREEHFHWVQKNSEHERMLQKRLKKLAALRGKNAQIEWIHFFEKEFLPEEKSGALMLLLETVRKSELPENILGLIWTVMEDRRRRYAFREEQDLRRLEEEIMLCCQRKHADAKNKKVQRKPLSRLWILPALAAAFLVIAWSGQRAENTKMEEVSIEAAAHLNEKYGGGYYSEENFIVEKETLFNDDKDEMEYYRIREEERGPVIVCAMRNKKSKEKAYSFFDNVQAKEIKQAFAERINERTGHAEGCLFWDSKTDDYSSGGIEDGFFQVRYEGDFDAFIQSEIEARRKAPKMTNASSSSDARPLNGICEYYLPDPEVKTLKEKFERQDFPEDAELQTALEECASDYQLQVRGIMLPESFFEERMRNAAWDESEVSIGSDVMRSLGIEPSIPFLMLTGWYLSMPLKSEREFNIPNGMYTRETVLMGEGIYGAENQIRSYNFGLDSDWMEGSIEQISTPEFVELTEAERKRAVSFQMREGYALQTDCCLAIDKEAYGIAESGYQVIITDRYDGKAQNYRMDVKDYGVPYTNVRGGSILDGEGYVFLEYPEADSIDKAEVVTIINP